MSLHFLGLFLCLLPRQHSSSSFPHKHEKNTRGNGRSDQKRREKNPEKKGCTVQGNGNTYNNMKEFADWQSSGSSPSKTQRCTRYTTFSFDTASSLHLS
jgi:hypothetical protein